MRFLITLRDAKTTKNDDKNTTIITTDTRRHRTALFFSKSDAKDPKSTDTTIRLLRGSI